MLPGLATPKSQGSFGAVHPSTIDSSGSAFLTCQLKLIVIVAMLKLMPADNPIVPRQVVDAVKRIEGTTTLAIGDGANDVSMIKKAVSFSHRGSRYCGWQRSSEAGWLVCRILGLAYLGSKGGRPCWPLIFLSGSFG